MTAKNRTWNRSVVQPSTWTYDYMVSGVPYHQAGTMTQNMLTPSEGTFYTWTKDWKFRSWNTTPNWKTLLASQGWLATLAMSERAIAYSQPRYTAIAVIPGASNRVVWTGAYAYQPNWSQVSGPLTSAEVTAAQTDAQYKVLSRARDMKTNVAVALGEGRQTVRMIADAARKLGTAYAAFRKGHFKKVAKVLGVDKPTGTAANHWLEWSYGWKPLVSDLKGLAELAAQHVEDVAGRKPRFAVRAKALRTYEAPIGVYGSDAPSPIASVTKSNYIGLEDGGLYVKANAGLLCELEYTSAALAAQTGFAIWDPALLAWELTPFSFVFDWFVDVGSYLESLSSLQGLKVLTGFVSNEQVAKGEFALSFVAPWAPEGILPRTPIAFRRYNRTLWTGSVSAIRTPLWDGLNARRITTSGALWRQRCRGDRVPGKYRP